MRLNLQSDYALRLLMQLAANDGDLVTIGEVAECYGISQNHLTKVAYTLGRKGFVETVRGRSGGMRLARPASSIRIGDVVREMESDLALVECFPGGAGGCHIAGACKLKGVLGEALLAFLAVLDRYTIADLIRRNAELNQMLSLEASP